MRVRVDGTTLVEARGLSKRYPATVALDDFNLTLEPGTIGLVGANGAGKSTLIKILLGLLEPTTGCASVMGFDVLKEGTSLRQHVGYMPEHDCLPLDMNATEFVAHMAEISGLPGSAARERTAEILRHVGLFEARYRQMAGYSTGMRQRVKLAQALVHDPDFVLLDEPTNGLDPVGRDEMLELIERTGKGFGISVMLASHLLGEIERVCDQVVVINAGRLVHQGPVAELTSATETLEVDVEGDARQLAARLARDGIDATVDGRTVLVSFPGTPPFAAIRDAIVTLDLGLVRMKQRRRRLEDLFRAQPAPQHGDEAV